MLMTMWRRRLQCRNSLMALSMMALFYITVNGKECKQQGACSCQYDDGSMVDLTSLGNNDGTPRFKDVQSDSDDYYYSYNPCFGFSEGNCSNAAVCVLSGDKSQSIQIGDAKKAELKYNADLDNVVAAYTAGTPGTRLMLSEVILECDQTACEPKMHPKGTQEQIFQMTLKTFCACPNGCSASGPINCGKNANSEGGTGGLTTGDSICIVFFSVLIVYVVSGVLIQKYARKKEGVEIIPNVVFWRALPVLIKNGFVFTFSQIKKRCRKSTYSEV